MLRRFTQMPVLSTPAKNWRVMALCESWFLKIFEVLRFRLLRNFSSQRLFLIFSANSFKEIAASHEIHPSLHNKSKVAEFALVIIGTLKNIDSNVLWGIVFRTRGISDICPKDAAALL